MTNDRNDDWMKGGLTSCGRHTGWTKIDLGEEIDDNNFIHINVKKPLSLDEAISFARKIDHCHWTMRALNSNIYSKDIDNPDIIGNILDEERSEELQLRHGLKNVGSYPIIRRKTDLALYSYRGDIVYGERRMFVIHVSRLKTSHNIQGAYTLGGPYIGSRLFTSKTDISYHLAIKVNHLGRFNYSGNIESPFNVFYDGSPCDNTSVAGFTDDQGQMIFDEDSKEDTSKIKDFYNELREMDRKVYTCELERGIETIRSLINEESE